jgi:hypothetical protein
VCARTKQKTSKPEDKCIIYIYIYIYIVSSSLMTILNSWTFDPEQMIVPNIAINALTGLLIPLIKINNYKIVEKQQKFRNLSLKYMNILHDIQDKIANDTNIEPDEVRSIIKLYDDLISQNGYIVMNTLY